MSGNLEIHITLEDHFSNVMKELIALTWYKLFYCNMLTYCYAATQTPPEFASAICLSMMALEANYDVA